MSAKFSQHCPESTKLRPNLPKRGQHRQRIGQLWPGWSKLDSTLQLFAKFGQMLAILWPRSTNFGHVGQIWLSWPKSCECWADSAKHRKEAEIDQLRAILVGVRHSWSRHGVDRLHEIGPTLGSRATSRQLPVNVEAAIGSPPRALTAAGGKQLHMPLGAKARRSANPLRHCSFRHMCRAMPPHCVVADRAKWGDGLLRWKLCPRIRIWSSQAWRYMVVSLQLLLRVGGMGPPACA